MSPTHRPADKPAQPARPGDEDAPAPLAPNSARAVSARPRKVIPLRQSPAPPIVPAQGAPSPGGPRLSGPDLLAHDAAFRQLLSARSDPLTVQPVRDPVGLALGVVARLMVGACAAAGVAMLLLGALPLPSRMSAPTKSEIAAAPAHAAPAATADEKASRTANMAPSPDRRPAAPLAKVASLAGDASPSAAPAPVRVATVSVHSRLAEAAAQVALDADEVARLVKRGEESLAQGDIAAARLILGRVAEAHDAQAALSLGATFDPAVLRQLRVVGARPDIAQARAWYEKAAASGSAEAARRLAALPRIDH